MTPGKIAILAGMLMFGLFVWWMSSPREPPVRVASAAREADAAMEVCRYAIREALGDPPGLVWSESGALPDHADGIWNVSIMYRANGVSPRISFCKLRPMGDGSWQSLNF